MAYGLKKFLDFALYAEPFELNGAELVGAHDRLSSLSPVGLKLSAACFLREKFSRIFVLFVILEEHQNLLQTKALSVW